MANRNQPPLNALPLPPLDHDVQYLNSLVRLLNNNFNAIKNPGASRVTAQVMTDAPRLPYDQNTGQLLEDGTVWNDHGFLKILPDGNPGDVYAYDAYITHNLLVGNLTTSKYFLATNEDSTLPSISINVDTPLLFGSPTDYQSLVYSTALNALCFNANSLAGSPIYAFSMYSTGATDQLGPMRIQGTQVVTNQQPSIPDASPLDPIAVTGTADLVTGAVTGTAVPNSSDVVDTVNSILAALRAHGLIAT